MPLKRCLALAAACFFVSTLFAGGSENRPNVLFIAIDDLRPELGCYGAEHILSPSIDKLAREGVRFDRAYCQQALCGPSRASLLTGLRPDSSQIHGNHVHFRKHYPRITTLPQHFKTRGYHTQSMGKIYHGVFPPGSSLTVPDTFGDAPSWSVPTYRPGPRYYYTEEGVAAARESFKRMYRAKNPGPDDWTRKLVFGPMTEAPDVPDTTLYDGKVAQRAVETLRRLAGGEKPFFLAVGFIKPHTPFIAPKKYWDLYAPSRIELAVNPKVPEGAPPLAIHSSGEIRRYTDQPKRGPFTEANQRRLRHGYRACVSYIDAQVGRVIDELDRLGLKEKTIVVLWSDHGYHLGEHGLWGKTTNFELDTRVALIIRAPGKKGNGQASEALVELVDLYPTLADLAGLPIPGHLEGTSMARLLDNPDLPWKAFANSQYTRGRRRGYSIRSHAFRYTEWYDLASGKRLARELYDHTRDPGETVNVANLPKYKEQTALLSRRLRRGRGWSREHDRFSRGGPGLTLAPVFTDHMVLQRDKPVRVWGQAPPCRDVFVRFREQKKKAVTGKDGRWTVIFSPMAASTKPYTLEASSGGESVSLKDVLVGDVWLCAGQSNMRWPLSRSASARVEIEQAGDTGLRLLDLSGGIYPSGKEYPLAQLRRCTVENYYATAGWQHSAPESAATFSAVGYFFGHRLRRELAVPIGLVLNAVGGVPMESYLPRETIETDPKLKPLVDRWFENPAYPAWCAGRGRLNISAWLAHPVPPSPHHPFEPGFLFEAGMRPLLPFALKGFIWYQGESNATVDGSRGSPVDPKINGHKLVSMIQGWRRLWNDPELPFYFVQLPGLNRPWAPFREMQLTVSRTVPHTGMAVTIDVGHPTNVHPSRKKPVGHRLARLALARTYGRDIVASGPVYRAVEMDGPRCIVSFDQLGGGLATSDGRKLRGFQVAGEDRRFRDADAEIRNDRVTVSSSAVSRAAAVRYAWADDPKGNLVNDAGLPASPFRTDRWPLPVVSGMKDEKVIAGTSFEKAEAGPITVLRTEVGTWKALAGHAEIDKAHARTGRQSLHILGGENRRIELVPLEIDESRLSLSFWAERWTRREPFRCRVEALVGGTWQEIYSGDGRIRIGRFPSPVRIDLPESTQRLRWTLTTPAKSGLLLDDLKLHPQDMGERTP